MKKFTLLFSLFASLLVAHNALAQAPTVSASNLQYTNIYQNQLNITWTRGNGDYCIVVCRPTSSGVAFPTNGINYAASTTYGSGSNLGSNN